MRRSAKAALVGGALFVAAAASQAVRGWAVYTSRDSVAEYWRERAESGGEVVHVALGDSTAQGVGASRPQEGYVGRLADDLAVETGKQVRVVNLSVTGARVADLVREQLSVFEELLSDGVKPDLVTVTIGANDTGRTATDDFERDMRRVIDVLPSGAFVADVPYFRGVRGGSAVELSGVIRRLVSERPDLRQVDLWIATKGLRPREYAADLFHPSTAGYDRYYRAFRSA